MYTLTGSGSRPKSGVYWSNVYTFGRETPRDLFVCYFRFQTHHKLVGCGVYRRLLSDDRIVVPFDDAGACHTEDSGPELLSSDPIVLGQGLNSKWEVRKVDLRSMYLTMTPPEGLTLNGQGCWDNLSSHVFRDPTRRDLSLGTYQRQSRNPESEVESFVTPDLI